MKHWKKISAWTFVILMVVGFRISPERWDISPSDPTIWIKVCPENSATIEENDITGSDALAGLSGVTFAQVLQSVLNDYNNSPTSYLRLAPYPADPNNPGAPAAGQSAFTIAKAEKRTIEICFGATDASAGLAGGYAMPKSEGRQYISCQIKAKPEHAKKTSFLAHLIVHEMGHCFGLKHAQEGTHAVMSYFGDKKFRLQRDDIAGLTYAYPVNEQYAKEAATFGLTGCEPRN